MRARWWRADITQKCIFWHFLIHTLLVLARSARATARAITKCTPIDSDDKIEVFCTINHYRNFKIDEFTICRTFVENRFFRKFLTFFFKKLDFLKNDQISMECKFINFYDMIMIYSANLIYLTMWIRFEEFFDGAHTAHPMKCYFWRIFYIGQLYERANIVRAKKFLRTNRCDLHRESLSYL